MRQPSTPATLNDTPASRRFRAGPLASIALGASLAWAATLWTGSSADAVPTTRFAQAITSVTLGAVDADDIVGMSLEPMGFYRVPDGADMLVVEWLPWTGDLGDEVNINRLDELHVRFSIDGVFETDWRCVRNAVLVRSGEFVRNQNTFRVRMDGVYLDHATPPAELGASDPSAFSDELLRGIEDIQERMIERNAEAMQAILRSRPAPPPVLVTPPAVPEPDRDERAQRTENPPTAPKE